MGGVEGAVGGGWRERHTHRDARPPPRAAPRGTCADETPRQPQQSVSAACLFIGVAGADRAGRCLCERNKPEPNATLQGRAEQCRNRSLLGERLQDLLALARTHFLPALILSAISFFFFASSAICAFCASAPCPRSSRRSRRRVGNVSAGLATRRAPATPLSTPGRHPRLPRSSCSSC